MLSPVEGVLVSVNHEVLKNPNLVVEDPYKNGWLCVVKAPELAINVKNLLQGPIVAAWMQNSIARLGVNDAGTHSRPGAGWRIAGQGPVLPG